jgi:hypothetical protein
MGAEPWPLQHYGYPIIVGAKALPLPSDPIYPCILKFTVLALMTARNHSAQVYMGRHKALPLWGDSEAKEGR